MPNQFYQMVAAFIIASVAMLLTACQGLSPSTQFGANLKVQASSTVDSTVGNLPNLPAVVMPVDPDPVVPTPVVPTLTVAPNVAAIASEMAGPTFRNFPSAYLTLNPGQTENVGGVILQVTTTGDIQVVNAMGALLWHTNTQASCGSGSTCGLVMQSDGNLVLYANGQGIWGSSTNNRGAFLTLTNSDPYLTIHDTKFNVVWSSSAKMSNPAAMAIASRVGSYATPVGSFLSSLAVNSHVLQNGYTAQSMLAMLNYLGVHTIRDGYAAADETQFVQMAQAGVHFDLVFGDPYASASLTDVETVAAMAPGAVIAIEGPNEINNFEFVNNGVKSQPGWPNTNGLLAQSFMTKMFSIVHGDSKLGGVPVYDLTWAGTTNAQGYGMLDLANQADFGNIHFYPPGQPYESMQSTVFSLYHHVLPNQAVFTETGFDTANVSETAQAILNVNLYLDAFQLGYQKTYIYELYDEWQTYGLFHHDLTPKKSATAIHNLTTILADSGTSTSTNPLNYQVTGLPAHGHTLLLQKSNKKFELIIWNEAEVSLNGNDIAVASTPVTVNLGATYSGVSVFDPQVSTTAIQQTNVTSTVTVNLASHQLVIEITP